MKKLLYILIGLLTFVSLGYGQDHGLKHSGTIGYKPNDMRWAKTDLLNNEQYILRSLPSTGELGYFKLNLTDSINALISIGSITLAGDVSGPSGSNLIGAGKVTYAKLAQAVKDSIFKKLDRRTAIVAGTNTKITYGTDGLILSATAATTADINDSSNKRYVTDANLVTIGNQSGVNTGDQNLAPYLLSATAASTYLTQSNASSTYLTISNAASTYQPIGSYQTQDATLTALAAYNTNGILVQTSADNFAGRTNTGTSNRLDITNGNGVSGNPTFDISTSYVGQSSITTLGTVVTATWNATPIGSNYGGAGIINGILKANGSGVVSLAASGTDYEVPITFSTGLTRSVNTVTVNAIQNITRLSNLTANGIVTTSGSNGTLSIDATSYLSTSSASSTYMPLAGGTFVGNVLATDNTYDLGASGATRFRTAYLGTSVVSPNITGLNGTNRSFQIKATDLADGFPFATFQATSGTNTGQALTVVPKGTGFNSTIKAQIGVANTDLIADATNTETFLLRSTGTDGYGLMNLNGGTGVARQIWINATGAQTSATANVIYGTNQSVTFQPIPTTGNGISASTSTLTSGNLMSLASTSTAAASNTNTVLNISSSGANANPTQTTWGLDVSNTHTGTSSTNIAARFTASGGTDNYAAQFVGRTTLTGNTNTSLLDLTASGSQTNPNPFITFKKNDGTVYFTINSDSPFNIFIGKNSGDANIPDAVGGGPGTANTCVGYQALQFNTTGRYNSAFGTHALNAVTTARENTACGSNALLVNQTGDYNTAVGAYSLSANSTSGTQNTAVGRYAMRQANNGSYNTSIGASSMMVVTGQFNVGAGYNSLMALTSGSSNCAMGLTSLAALTTGTGNIAIGQYAGYGDISDIANEHSVVDTYMGFYGFQASRSSSISNASVLTNGMAIGKNAKVSTSNTLILGAVSTDNIKVGINMITATARLHLPAGTTTANTAPFKLTSGTNLTTGEAGAMEYDGVELYFTPSGTTRETVAYISDIPTATSGTYTPTATNVTNITSSTPNISSYQRVGNIVTVYGTITVTNTLALASEVDVTLPVASNFAAATDLNGIGQSDGTFAVNTVIKGDAVNDRASIYFTGASVGGNGILYFSFQYKVL